MTNAALEAAYNSDPQALTRTPREWDYLRARDFLTAIHVLTGTPIRRIHCFDQSVWWSSRNGWIPVSEIRPDHAANLCAFLRRGAAYFHGRYVSYALFSLPRFASPYEAPDEVNDSFDHLIAQPPLDWVTHTDLYLAVESRILDA